MKHNSFIFESAAILAATTIGAGMFALPYVFLASGWAVGIFYIIGLSALLIFVHALYVRVLERVRERVLLLGLVRKYGGSGWFVAGFVAIIGGLFMTLAVYLILGERFLSFVIPHTTQSARVLIFWIVSSFPIVFRAKRLARVESFGALAILALVLALFLGDGGGGVEFPAYDSAHLFFPFGVILFALAGWNALLPMYEYGKAERFTRRKLFSALVLGTAAVAGFYLMFVWGIGRSVAVITPDTISGLANWSSTSVILLGILGLFALFTSYAPIGFEINHALAVDMSLSRWVSVAAVFTVPLILFFAGLDDFLGVVRLAGGVFLSLQYLLILFVARKVLSLTAAEKFFVRLANAVFTAAILYETYYFVVG